MAVPADRTDPAALAAEMLDGMTLADRDAAAVVLVQIASLGGQLADLTGPAKAAMMLRFFAGILDDQAEALN